MFSEESFYALSSIASSLSCFNNTSSWETLIDAFDSSVSPARKLIVLYSAEEAVLLIKRGTSNNGKTTEGYDYSKETVLLDQSFDHTGRSAAVLKASDIHREWATANKQQSKRFRTMTLLSSEAVGR